MDFIVKNDFYYRPKGFKKYNLMKKMKITLCILITVMSFVSTSQAQGILDGFAVPKGELSITASYTRSTFHEFYVGEELTGPVPAHEEIDQNIFSLYAKYGVNDKFSFILSLPYISAQGNGVADPVNGETDISDFQDISVYGKYLPYTAGLPGGKLAIVTGAGVSFPLGYEPNGILSVGSGAFTTNFHAGFHLQADSGIFTTLIAGYSLRSDADDNFNVLATGDFDVPNAFLLSGKLGYAASKFYVEGWVDYQSSTSGIDINDADFGGRFPETNVEYTRLGATVYVPVTSTIGLSAGYGTVVDGRNLGDANNISGGITFNLDTNK